MPANLYTKLSGLSSDDEEDSLSEPGSLSCSSPKAKRDSLSSSLKSNTQGDSQRSSDGFSHPGQVTPKKRPARDSGSHSDFGSPRQVKPGRRCVIAKAEAASIHCREGRADSDEEDCSDSSASESEVDSDDEYTGSPHRKIKSKAKVTVSSSDARVRRALAVAKKEKGLFREDDDMIRQSQEDSRARLEDIDRLLAMGCGSQASSSSSVSVPREAGKLRVCPFCHEEMPKIKSKKLIAVMQHWLNQYHQKRRIGSTATLEACQQHRNEKSIIPEGNKKWRKRLNKEKLRLQIENEKNGFMSVMRERIENPKSSEWFHREIEVRKAIGRQADNVSAQMQRLDDEQAGYFGELGWEVMRSSLISNFITRVDDKKYDLKHLCSESASKMANLSPEKFVERILAPELVLLLIINDAKGKKVMMTMDEARQVRNESTLYGIAMFPSTAMGDVSHGRNVFGDKLSPSQPMQKRKDVEKKASASQTRRAASSSSDLQDSSIHTESPKTTPKKVISRSKATASTAASASSSWPGGSSRPRPRPLARPAVTTSVIDLASPSGPESDAGSSPLLSMDEWRERRGDDGDRTFIVSSSTSARANDYMAPPSSSSLSPPPSTDILKEQSSISTKTVPHKPMPRPAYRNLAARPSGRIEGY